MPDLQNSLDGLLGKWIREPTRLYRLLDLLALVRRRHTDKCGMNLWGVGRGVLHGSKVSFTRSLPEGGGITRFLMTIESHSCFEGHPELVVADDTGDPSCGYACSYAYSPWCRQPWQRFNLLLAHRTASHQTPLCNINKCPKPVISNYFPGKVAYWNTIKRVTVGRDAMTHT